MSVYWRLASLYGVYFLVVGAMAPYWSLYLQHLGFAPLAMGILLAAPQLTQILIPNFWGWLADVTGRYQGIMQLGALGACLGFLGVFWRQDFLGLGIFIVLFSAFWNAILPQVEAITLASLVDNTHLYSRVRLWGSVGFIVAVLSLGWCFDRLSIAYLPHFLFAGLLGLGAMSFALPKLPARQRPTAQMGLWPVLRQPRVHYFLLAALAFQMSHGIYYGFYSVHLAAHGYSHSQIGMLWTLGVVAEIALFWLLPQVFKRLNIEWCLIGTMVVGALRWLLIALWVDSPWLLAPLQLLHAVTFALFHACAIEFIRRSFGVSQQGQGQALYAALSYGLGGALGVYGCGYFWSLGPPWAFIFAVSAALVGAVLAIQGFLRQAP